MRHGGRFFWLGDVLVGVAVVVYLTLIVLTLGCDQPSSLPDFPPDRPLPTLAAAEKPAPHPTTILEPPARPAALVKAGILPDPNLTPGAIYAYVTAADVSKPGYAGDTRDVPESIKKQVFAEYGIKNPRPGEYEIDHNISLELGGSNDIHNLWPQSYQTKPLNAHVKDALEDRLHALVKARKITLRQAQDAINGDWTAAYVKYIGPLPPANDSNAGRRHHVAAAL